MKVLTYDQSKCNNCGACQVICSLGKKGKAQPSEARIHMRNADGPEALRAAVCQHCAEPACVTACMRGIIKKDPITGKVSRKTEDCFRCAACSVMCPVGAVVLDHDAEAFVTCDFCGGNPICVKVCPTHALRYEEEKDASEVHRNQYAQKALGEVEAERK